MPIAVATLAAQMSVNSYGRWRAGGELALARWVEPWPYVKFLVLHAWPSTCDSYVALLHHAWGAVTTLGMFACEVRP